MAIEYRIVKELDLPGVIKIHSLEKVGHSKANIMEDFGAISLDNYLSSQPIDLDSFLHITTALTDIIFDTPSAYGGELHFRKVFLDTN